MDNTIAADPTTSDRVEPIAIVGLAVRLPGAADAQEFWRNLLDGVESVTTFTREEQLARGVKASDVDDPGWVSKAPVVDGYDEFDAGLFGLTGREAELMDPQHRIFLEQCFTALQDAGYDPGRYDGAIGVYAGTGGNTYLFEHILKNKRLGGSPHAAVSIATGSSPNYVATNVSYRLDLRGPSMTVHTACSTSLVAFHLACEALRNGECDMALAGGVNIELPQAGYLGMEGFTSPDGRCRPFDAGANGTVWGSGAGVTLLKRLSDAVADGDSIRAVVLGNAINNDGAAKVGFTAPSIDGQVGAVAQAVDVAGIDPRTISYVEAHGTGTAMGDPIEVAALTTVYGRGTGERGWCGIGSVKSNIGHLSQPSGVVGVIKTVLALEHGLIPPTINYETPNPAIDFADTPFYVVNSLTKWDTDGAPRRAGVSSFGIGGTNAHVVLEEAPADSRTGTRRTRPAHLLQVSAKTPTALDAAVARLADHLAENPHGPGGYLADVAHTLRVGRPEYPFRASTVATDLPDAVVALRTERRQRRGSAEGDAARIALLFSGQGAQHPGMGAQLYAEEPAYAAVVDECARVLAPELSLDLRDLILGRDPQAAEQLNQTRFTQPALFVVEYALAALWSSYGVRPEAMLGHSIGEYVAATVAGVFALPDALRLVAARGRLMQSLPTGAMLGIQLDESEVAGRLPDGVTVATVNGPGMCVVSGDTEAVAAFAATLRKGKSKLLRTSHAFHSPMMEPILPEFTALVAATRRHTPRIPFLSNVTGTWITAEQATDPAYWAAHLRQPVRFGAGVATLLAGGTWQLLECGPGRQLSNLARMQVAKGEPAQRALVPLASLPSVGDADGDLATLLTAAGALWSGGVPVRLPADPGASRVPLPAYPFERRRYWVDPDPVGAVAEPPAPRGPRALADWFAVPTWRQAPADRRSEPLGRVLVLAGGPRGAALLAALRAVGAEPIEVRHGDAFGVTDTGFQVNPGVREDYDALVGALGEAGVPDRVVHAFALDGEPAGRDIAAAWAAQERGFFSVLHLAQALAGAGLTADAQAPVRLELVCSGIGDVRGGDLVRPEHATLAGLARVLPVELPGLAVRLIDADPEGFSPPPRPGSGCAAPNGRDGDLVAEVCRPAGARRAEVALRGGRRWVTDYEQVSVAGDEQVSAGGDAVPGALREGGRYLITGGLGGIGITLAEDFASRARARLVLVSRSGLPPRQEWEEYLAVHGEPADRAGRAIAAIGRMERAGAQVLVLAADVTDPADLRRVREAAEAAFGGLDGIVHAAGLPGGGMAEVKERAEAERVLSPKLAGTLALAQVFGELPLDFVALCSSITAVVGGFGQVDYCAANNFLDAYARSDHGWSAPLVSQNWGGWAEVGMAAEVAAPAGFRALTHGAHTRPLSHPVLTTVVAGPERAVLHGRVSAGSHWILDEHRIGGQPVVPGTAHLECVRAAVAEAVPAAGGAAAVELRDVVFLEPFMVRDGAVAEYRVELTGSDGGMDFSIQSLSAGRLTTHAHGWAGWTDEPPAPVLDLAAVTARCEPVDDGGDAFGRRRTSMVSFGPRWDALREHHVGPAEELARIEAPEAAGGDLPAWGLHPALLDVATAFGRGRGEGTYLPLSYGRIVVRGALPATFFSHLRYRDSGTEEVVVADLSLVDTQGRELVAISDFVLRRVNQDAVTSGLAAAEAPAASGGAQPEPGLGAAGHDPRIPARPGAPTEAIRPADGAEAFRRSLVAGLGAQVVIATRPVADIRDRVRGVTTEVISTGFDSPATGGGDPASPRAELEAIIAQVWRDGLGVDVVGVDDDFFALGGNSLVAVQLIATMRKATGVRLPMRSLFETPTVAGLAARIEELRAVGPAEATEPPDDAPDTTTIPRLPRA